MTFEEWWATWEPNDSGSTVDDIARESFAAGRRAGLEEATAIALAHYDKFTTRAASSYVEGYLDCADHIEQVLRAKMEEEK